jgi:hypothetical protein
MVTNLASGSRRAYDRAVVPQRPLSSSAQRQLRIRRAQRVAFPLGCAAFLAMAAVSAILDLDAAAAGVLTTIAVLAAMLPVLWRAARLPSDEEREARQPLSVGSWVLGGAFLISAFGPVLLVAGDHPERIVGLCLTIVFAALLLSSPLVAARQRARRG